MSLFKVVKPTFIGQLHCKKKKKALKAWLG